MCPTHITSLLPLATTSALISLPTATLIAAHFGPDTSVLFAFASLVRQRDIPPARIRFGSFGSRTNGAIKLASRFLASGILYGKGFQAQSDPVQYWPLMNSADLP